MRKYKRYLILFTGLFFLITSSVMACASVPELGTVESYLEDTETIINGATDIALQVSSLYKTAKQLYQSEVVQKCTIHGKEYDELFDRFIGLECPSECLKLREYLIDGISYSKQEVTEYGAYFATGNNEHLYKAESYYNDAQRAIALAAGEWDRLREY